MLLNGSLRTRRFITLVFLFCGLIIVLQCLKESPKTGSSRNKQSRRRTGSETSLCDAFPDPGNVAIALKTGATEAVEKIPIQMVTTLQCAQDVMIFSDLDQTIAGYHLRDALVNIPKSAMENNPEFDYYWKLKEAKKYGQIERMLKHTTVRDIEGTELLASWVLDKYKHLHMWEMLYAAYPRMDWYLMMDADTYLVWPNFVTWLQQLPNPISTGLCGASEPFLKHDGENSCTGETSMGYTLTPGQHCTSEVSLNKEVWTLPTAVCSGILVSQATMHNLTIIHRGMASRFDEPLRELCCGDLVTGVVLKEIGIEFKNAWPTINGEKPSTMLFGPDYWCEPVVTMHHVEPHEMNELANFEMSRRSTQEPLTFAELFNEFTREILPDFLDDWDNLCDDYESDADSYEACRGQCEDDPDCFQFQYNGTQCLHGWSIHLGRPSESDTRTKLRSGWLRDRVMSWVDRQAPCEPKFPWTSPASQTHGHGTSP